MTGDNALIVAVDLGGTYTKIAMIDREGTVRAQDRLVTRLSAFADGDRGQGTLDWLADRMTKFADDQTGQLSATWCGFGVILPGIINSGKGLVRAAANIGWYDFPVVEKLTARLGVAGAVDHDVRTAGRAEWQLGAGRAIANLLFVPLGTGIAAAAVVDGRLLEADGYAGEIGHMPVPSAGQTRCACGGIGCLETVASAAGVARTYAARTGSQQSESSERIAELARSGDDDAGEAFRLAADALSEALITALTIAGPEVIVLGGGLSGAADLLTPRIESAFDEQLTIQRRPRITTSTFGSSGGIVGAGLLGWHAVDAASSGREG